MVFLEFKRNVKNFLLNDAGNIGKDNLLRIGLLSLILGCSVKESDAASIPCVHYSASAHTSDNAMHINKDLHIDDTTKTDIALYEVGGVKASEGYVRFAGTSEDHFHVNSSDHAACNTVRVPNEDNYAAEGNPTISGKSYHKNSLSLDSSGTAVIASHAHNVHVIDGATRQAVCTDHGASWNSGSDHISCGFVTGKYDNVKEDTTC